MKIVKLNKIPKMPFIDPLFTGTDVTKQSLVSDSKDLNLYIVNFGKGTRNRFHRHNGDQILIVIAGKGIVATDKENRMVTIGDIVVFPAGEKHWHGATEDSEFSHIVITREGVKFTPAKD
jgi:quercetin dioxygenase-like cupin family protein